MTRDALSASAMSFMRHFMRSAKRRRHRGVHHNVCCTARGSQAPPVSFCFFVVVLRFGAFHCRLFSSGCCAPHSLPVSRATVNCAQTNLWCVAALLVVWWRLPAVHIAAHHSCARGECRVQFVRLCVVYSVISCANLRTLCECLCTLRVATTALALSFSRYE